jgi:hypothetical protein
MANANQTTERFTRRLRNGLHTVLGHRVREVTTVTWCNGVRTELNRAECECGWSFETTGCHLESWSEHGRHALGVYAVMGVVRAFRVFSR